MQDQGPVWDDKEAERLIGSKVLLGLTYVHAQGDRQEQMFGHVTAADRDGITILLDGRRAGEVFRLPPDLRSFKPAASGEYRLRSTGETVVDPDYACTWTIHPPPH